MDDALVTTDALVFKEPFMRTSGSNNTRDGIQDSLADEPLPSILVVDDSHDSANILGSLFDVHGYKTYVAYDWEAALETARAHLPDVILLDLGMPELDGIHLARFFREDEQLNGKVLLAVTGYADATHRAQCDAVGFDYVLAKPTVWKDLKSTIDHLFRMKTCQNQASRTKPEVVSDET